MPIPIILKLIMQHMQLQKMKAVRPVQVQTFKIFNCWNN